MNVDKKMSPTMPIRTSAKGGQNEIGVPCPFIIQYGGFALQRYELFLNCARV